MAGSNQSRRSALTLTAHSDSQPDCSLLLVRSASSHTALIQSRGRVRAGQVGASFMTFWIG